MGSIFCQYGLVMNGFWVVFKQQNSSIIETIVFVNYLSSCCFSCYIYTRKQQEEVVNLGLITRKVKWSKPHLKSFLLFVFSDYWVEHIYGYLHIPTNNNFEFQSHLYNSFHFTSINTKTNTMNDDKLNSFIYTTIGVCTFSTALFVFVLNLLTK